MRIIRESTLIFDIKSSTTGEPIKDTVVAIFTDKKGGIVLTDAQGKYKICGLDTGTYDIAVGGEGYEIKEEVNIQILGNQETIIDYSLIKQTEQGFNYKKEDKKIGLKTGNNFFEDFFTTPIYAFQPGTREYQCCVDNCMKGWLLRCLTPSNRLAWILLFICGPLPIGPGPGTLIAGKFLKKLYSPLFIFCTAYNVGGLWFCYLANKLGCELGCLE